MASRLSGQTSIFGVVVFVSKSLLGIKTKKNLKNIIIIKFDPKASESCKNIGISSSAFCNGC